MRFVNLISDMIMPLVTVYIIFYGYRKKIDIVNGNRAEDNGTA